MIDNGNNWKESRQQKGKPRWSNYFDKKKKQDDDGEDDDDAMDIDRLSPEKCTALMKKGACFICKEPGHMAREHDDYERKKKKTTIRQTNTPSKSLSKKKSIKEIHALLQALSPNETKELLALQASEKEQEEKEDEKKDEDSDF